MFSVYAVKVRNGEKHRHYIGTFETLDEAKHLSNCLTCGNADYAYVKESGIGATVFYLTKPESYYDPRPIV